MSNSIIEKDGRNDTYYIESVSQNAPPSQPTMQPYQRTYGNPAPLGMLAFATIFLCSSLLTLHAGNVTTPNIVLVFATFYAGISQTLVGMWEMFLGNTFSATVFATYGGFNLSYGALYMPQIGLAAAYTVDGVVGEEFDHAVGIYLGIWAFITFVFLLGAIRTTIPIVVTFFFTVISLSCSSASSFTGNTHLNTAGGAFGIIASLGAYYGSISLFWTQQTTMSYIRLPPLVLTPSNV